MFMNTSNHSFPPQERRCRYVQGVATKSYKLRANLVDFGGTAQKEQLVYLARGAMSMSELMANPAHSTIVGISYFGMGKPCQSVLIDVRKTTHILHFGTGQPCQSLLIDVSKKTCI